MKRLSSIIGIAVVTAAVTAVPAQARFQVRCMPSHVATEDPIVSPGMPAAHEHEFFGNTTTGAFSTYESMIVAPTTCSTLEDTAGYWTPTLFAVDGTRVSATSLLIYYRGNANTVPFPPDLRMISDDVSVGGQDPSNVIVRFPECWDGVHLDSVDHRSHMHAVTAGQPCPDSHPVRLPELAEVFRYPVADVSALQLSSGGFETAHADFWNTWQQDALTALVERCINGPTDCEERVDSDPAGLTPTPTPELSALPELSPAIGEELTVHAEH
jgi:Domain of unknown function (DUF1996)